jgi:hypothetical protein
LYAALDEFVSAEGIDVDLSAIPEPSAIAVLGVALLGLSQRRHP